MAIRRPISVCRYLGSASSSCRYRRSGSNLLSGESGPKMSSMSTIRHGTYDTQLVDRSTSFNVGVTALANTVTYSREAFMGNTELAQS